MEEKQIVSPIPNWKTAIDYVGVHAGGRAVIDSIQKGLGFSDEDMIPSRTVLAKYGNTSSSSIWYEFKEIEKVNNVKRGQKIWLIAFGSGFKCNTVVWEKL